MHRPDAADASGFAAMQRHHIAAIHYMQYSSLEAAPM